MMKIDPKQVYYWGFEMVMPIEEKCKLSEGERLLQIAKEPGGLTTINRVNPTNLNATYEKIQAHLSKVEFSGF